jgi:uncharacterized protein YkwD
LPPLSAPSTRDPRRLAVVLVLVFAATLLPVPPPASAAVDASAEQEFVQLIQGERSARGLRSLTVCAEIRTVSRRHSLRMADMDHLHHNPNLGTEVKDWTRLAENVGVGPSVARLHEALMNSEGHRRNILDSEVTQIGVGVEVTEAGRMWVTQVFRRPASGAACTSVTTTTTGTTTEPPPVVNLTGDFNGDGEADLATFDPGTGVWTVRRHTTSGAVTETWGRFSTRTGWQSHVVGDFNADGRDDIASFHPGSGNWIVSTSTGSSFDSSVWTQFRTGKGWQSHLVGDFNADGRDDIASFHPGSKNWVVSRSNGKSFNSSVWTQFWTG